MKVKSMLRNVFLKILKILVVIIMLQNCKKQNNHIANNSNNIIIELESIIDDNIVFNDLYNTMHMSSLNEKFPEYYKSQLNYKGIDAKDSVVISTFNTDRKRFYYDLFIQGYINLDDYVKMKLDSLIEKEKPEQVQLVVAIMFKDNKQKLIIDENYNKDFSDDRITEFDKDFRTQANDSIINKLATHSFNYWNINNGEIISMKRKIIVHPSLNDTYFRPSEDEIVKKSRLTIDFKDYWKGKFNKNSIGYEIAIQGVFNSFLSILIKPDSLKFSKNDLYYNQNFAYQIKDTIEISNGLYIIDSINNDISKVHLKKINKKVAFFGHRMGQKLDNLELENLIEEKVNIYNISKAKKYTLIDFWGTWCKPCKELTPELKEIQQNYLNKLSVISVAYDKNKESVIDYTTKNNMNWVQAFIKINDTKVETLKKLKIKEYPTFILINNNNRIIYRGSEKYALKEIEQILAKK